MRCGQQSNIQFVIETAVFMFRLDSGFVHAQTILYSSVYNHTMTKDYVMWFGRITAVLFAAILDPLRA